MAPRSFWKGYLKLSLVTCAVALTPATSQSGRIRLHMLNPKTGNRLRSSYVDAETGAPVEEEEQVRGYEVEAGRYLMLEEEELDAIALESTHTIDVERFVPEEEVDRLLLDGAYWLTPDDAVGAEAFAVIRSAMAATGKAGLARLVLSRRERTVLLEPRGTGISVRIVRTEGEIRDDQDSFALAADADPPEPEVEAATKLIQARGGRWDPKSLVDEKEAALESLIAKKRKGRRPAASKAEPAEAPTTGGALGIMEALRRSLDTEKTPKAAPAKAGGEKTGTAKTAAPKATTPKSGDAKAESGKAASPAKAPAGKGRTAGKAGVQPKHAARG